ncbi:MAG: RNA polymerase sigma-I factor, partial [Lachnospiraceae bacterium]|nr:RNA polymerase sigma-I factor [Lachnospiraceae bacterium]
MNDLDQVALLAKQDDDQRQNFIQENEDLILRLASKACGSYVTKSDDYYSIALIAFNEAIDSYDEGKGKFTSFASLVIKRRILDEF